MSVDPILNKGIILYTGGETLDYSEFNEPMINQTTSDNEVLILNIEFIIQYISNLKNQMSNNRVISLPSSDIWIEQPMNDLDNQKLNLNNHASI